MYVPATVIDSSDRPISRFFNPDRTTFGLSKLNAFLKSLISVSRTVIRFSLYTFPFSFFINFSLFQWLRDLFSIASYRTRELLRP